VATTVTLQLEDDEIIALRDSLARKLAEAKARVVDLEKRIASLDGIGAISPISAIAEVKISAANATTGLNVYRPRVRRGTAKGRVKNALFASAEPISTAQISIRSGVSPASTRRVLKDLEDEGLAVREGDLWRWNIGASAEQKRKEEDEAAKLLEAMQL
jgi:hypothetical protein